jgi:hypothetical protein
MREPTLPEYTCKYIDKVKDSIESALKHADIPYHEEDIGYYADAISDIKNELECLDSVLEDIRAANFQLRECAEYWRIRARELESEVETLQQEIAGESC